MDVALKSVFVGIPTGARGKIARLVLVGGAPLMALMFAALGPVLPLMAEHFGGRTGGALAAQMILTMPAIGVILGGIAGGYSVERWGPKPVLVVALIAYAILGASGYLIDNLSILLVTRFLVGFSVAHVGTSIAVVVASWFEGVARVKLLGYQSAVAGVFAVICLLMSGLLAEAGGWRAPFLLYTMAFVVLFLVLAGLPRGVARVVPSQASSADRPSLRPLVTLWPIYALAMFLFVAYFMTSIQMSFLLSEDGVKSPLIRSIIIATGVLAGGIFGGFYGRFYAWLGERGVQIFLTTMMATGLGIIGFSTNLWMIALGVALSGGGGGMIPPHISGILLNRVPSVLRARAVGFEFTVLYIADFVNPLVITPLRAVIGIHNAFLVVAAALAVAVLAMAMVLKRHLPTG